MAVDRQFLRSEAPPSGIPIEFSARVAEPLIGSDDFAAWASNRCKVAAVQGGNATAELRFERLLRAVALLVSTPFAPHKIVDLAAAAGMSRSSFAACFAVAFGLPPMEFLTRERLRVAAYLLFTSSLSVKAVAGQTGYASASYFSRAFQAAFGVTPSEASTQGSKKRAASSPVGLNSSAASPHDAAGQMSREYLQLICDAALDVLWDIDLQSGLVWWGEGMSRVVGYAKSQIGPDTTWCHDHIHPDDRARVIAGMKAACDNGDLLWRDRFRYRKADNTYITVLDRGIIVRDAKGYAIRFLGAMNESVPSLRESAGTRSNDEISAGTWN